MFGFNQNWHKLMINCKAQEYLNGSCRREATKVEHVLSVRSSTELPRKKNAEIV